MKAIIPAGVFVLIGVFLLPVSACNGSTQASVEQQQTQGETKAKNGFEGVPAPGTTAFCPVMNHEFKVKKESPHSVYKGKTYVFCCGGCKPKFDENPQKYVKK